MPLQRNTGKAATDENFSEWREGKTFSRTRRKFGAKVAQKQMQAVVLSRKRKPKRAARKRAD